MPSIRSIQKQKQPKSDCKSPAVKVTIDSSPDTAATKREQEGLSDWFKASSL